MTPGKTCRICGDWKPLDEFHTYTNAAGTLTHHSYCVDCNREKSREAARTHRQRRTTAGMCYYCDTLSAPGRKMCDEHLRLARERTAARRAKIAI